MPISKTSIALRLVARPVAWLVASAALLAADYTTGPFVRFPVFFALPAAIAGWFGGARWGIPISVALALARLGFFWVWDAPYAAMVAVFNAGGDVVVGSTLAVLASRAARAQRLEREVQALEGILPICSFCKKMRESDGSWVRLERYIESRAEATFSHGVCPDCAEEHYGSVLRRLAEKAARRPPDDHS